MEKEKKDIWSWLVTPIGTKGDACRAEASNPFGPGWVPFCPDYLTRSHYYIISFPRRAKWLFRGGQPNRLGPNVTVNGGIYRGGFETASVKELTEAVMLGQPPRLIY